MVDDDKEMVLILEDFFALVFALEKVGMIIDNYEYFKD